MIIDLNQILSTFNMDYEIAKGNNQTEEYSYNNCHNPA